MSAITAAIFRDGKMLGHVALDAFTPSRNAAEVVWVEALDPLEADFAALQERLGLHPLAIEDSMRLARFPKVDLYEDQILVVLKSACLEGDTINYHGIDAFVSSNHIVTVRHGAGADPGRERFSIGSRFAQVRPDFILHGVVELIVSLYAPVVQMIEDEVLTMEQHLQDALLERQEITRLFHLRREAIHLRHVIGGMSAVCGKLTNLDVPCISAAAKPYFRDVHDQLVRLDAMISGLVDVIRTVVETSSLLELQRQGITTRQLAAWAAILGVPTAIAALHGVAFPDATVLDNATRVTLVAGATLAVCTGLYIRFKKARWL
jgi:magnesium transporter